MEQQKNGSDHKDHTSDNHESRPRDDRSQAPASVHAQDDANKTPKKRRKVNHACVYCRRSHMTCDLERPCTRCIKRNIGHLCHDEPRDHESKKSRSVMGGASTIDESETRSEMTRSSIDQTANALRAASLDASVSTGAGQPAKSGFDAGSLGRGNHIQLVQQNPATGIQANALSSSNMNQFAGFSDAWLTAQNHFHDMHNYHPNYMIVPEVSNEFNLLNDFLHSSLLDDGTLGSDDQNQLLRNEQNDMLPSFLNQSGSGSTNNLLPPSAGGAMPPPGSEQGGAIIRPASAIPADKAREYYLQAADPSGNDTPEERMTRVLRAKYDAGLLRPFNYIKGYAALSAYLDSHIAPSSKQKIIRQLDRFRPKFREKMQGLTDMELVYVEMWFERTLMEYDRVFASMAIPACCWRRTGEIFRGNKEMAELIHVPVDRLRDGKIALHEILTEESVVRYWEEFGTIAFDPAHDTLLTACSLKNPDDRSNDPIVKCAFSIKIRRDEHKIPSLIVGNFLPHDPSPN
ncbi:Transcription factor [Pleurostoma richardsiae]|uniref:Transcription factor n=1 Tax=Pleurostoma richardsiae TaxID=41990 RepID=A0AA38R6D4_9PEZI|nr:Transcription factor [Pleurostoma richardsiae]